MHDIEITNSAGLSTRCWVWVLEGQSISLQTRRLSLHPAAVRSVLSEVLDQLNAAEAQGSYRFKPAVHFSALPGSRPTCTVPDDDKRAVWFHFEEQNVSCVTWSSLQFVEVVVFCLLLYLYTRRKVKHIVVVMLLVALLGKDVENLPTFSASRARFVAWLPKMATCSPLSSQEGANEINTDQKSLIALRPINECENVTVVCCCSLGDGHLGQSRVRDDHGDHKRTAAVHLPHLLRHARRHVCLLWIPDQVSFHLSILFFMFFYCSKPLSSPQAGCNFKNSSIAVGNNI